MRGNRQTVEEGREREQTHQVGERGEGEQTNSGGGRREGTGRHQVGAGEYMQTAVSANHQCSL